MSIFEGFKFRQVTSSIHNLDPRTKFLYILIVFISAIMFSELLPLLSLFVIQMPFVFIAKIQKEWLRSLKGASLLALIIFASNIISIFIFSGYVWDYSMLEYSLALTLRFIVLIETFSIFFLTTSPDHLSLALQQSHVPYDICFAFTTAVRFVPVLANEAQTIMDAQRSRGLELDRGNFVTRIRNYIPILIPLIVSSIRRSLELAEAMESRAWGATENRTNLYILRLRRDDYILSFLSFLMITVTLLIRFYVPLMPITKLLST